jgi:agmatine/peptidylarginine deiminase
MTNTSIRLPAEWETQDGVMITWPHDRTDWRPWLDQVEPVFVELARHITAREALLLVCRDPSHGDHVLSLLGTAGIDPAAVLFHYAPSNDAWARDHGPITVLRGGRPRLLDFTFNGWGGKYPAELDNRITGEIHRQGAFPGAALEEAGLVLEGGGIDTDGEGSLLLTRRSLLSGNRNPDLDQSALESRLGERLGIRRFLWLEHGALEGDDTDSHIDTLARFCDPRTIAYQSCTRESDANYSELSAMEDELRGLVDVNGEPYRLIPLPSPQPIFDGNGGQLPASYANFLIINGAVLMPTYRDPADALALERLREAFPDREVIGIDCRPLIRQYGSLHCVTMQLPAGVLGGLRRPSDSG